MALTCIGLFRDASLTTFQKISQFIIALLIPVIGPALILCVIVSSHSREELKAILPFPFYYFGRDDVAETRRRRAGYEINHHMDSGDGV